MTLSVDSILIFRSEKHRQLFLWLGLVLILFFLAVPMPAIAIDYRISAESFVFDNDKGNQVFDPYKTITVKFKYKWFGYPSEPYKYMVFELRRVMKNGPDLHPRLFVIPLKYEYDHGDAIAKFQLPEPNRLYNLSYHVVPFLRYSPLSVSGDAGGYVSADEERKIQEFYKTNDAGTKNIAQIRSSWVPTAGLDDFPPAPVPAPAPRPPPAPQEIQSAQERPAPRPPPAPQEIQSAQERERWDKGHQSLQRAQERPASKSLPKVRMDLPLLPTVPYYWNSWFQMEGPKIVDELVVDEFITYTLVIDLSAYNYEDLFKNISISLGSAAVDNGFNKLLDNLIDRGIPSVKFIVRPIVIGDNIKLSDSEEISKPFEINLKKLRNPPKVRDLLGTDNLLNKNKEAYFKFAKQVQAGVMQLKIKANSSGCGAIALSIWNENGDVPLDHLIRIVKVRAPGESKSTCDDDGPPLRGGLETLLSTALSGGAKRQIQADAALHVFETKSKDQINSVVVFVDRSKIQKTSEDPGSQGDFVFSWEAVSSISNYLMEKKQLYIMLKAAHGKEEKYIMVAKELRDKIFTPKKPRDEKKAKDAFESLLKIAEKSDHEPILYARLVSAENKILFMPLGLLSAGGDNALLKKPIAIVQPLYRENFPHDNTCIEPWAFCIPKKLKEVKDEDLMIVDNIIGNTSNRIDDLTKLKSYLNESITLKEGEKGAGLILLAHHEGGYLWFEESSDRVIIEDVKRKFPPGSIAILSACSIGDTRGYDPPLVEVLNKSGVDAMIISPFPVPAEYGTQLAINFADIIVKEKNKGNTLTLAELFSMAAKQTGKYFKGSKDDLALEFTIVGDHMLKLCPKTTP
jgi:hypothetical protein